MKSKSTVSRVYSKTRKALDYSRARIKTQREKDMLYGAYMALEWVLKSRNTYWTPDSWLKEWEPRPSERP